MPAPLPRRARRALPSAAAAALLALAAGVPRAAGAQAPAESPPSATPFTLEQVKGYPFPGELVAATTGARLAWTVNARGRRNVWTAAGPDFAPRQLTHYTADDGQELTSVSLTPDGRYVLYVRGGEHGANWDDAPPNPASSPVPAVLQLWSVPAAGGAPKVIADGGDEPAISPRGDRVAFVKDRQVWIAPVDGSTPARRLVAARGAASEPRWSPDGSRLAFVAERGDHAFVGVFTSDSAPVVWLAPSTAQDESPRWSPDGRRIAFVRRPPAARPADSILVRRVVPWAVWTADATTGAGQALWQSPATLRGSYPTTDGGPNLDWAAGGRVVFLTDLDGWPHLYSVRDGTQGAPGGEPPLLLTPGPYMAEHVRLSPDGRTLVFAANAGATAGDVDRRHVVRVPVDRAAPEVLTPGAGLEWTPVLTGDGQTLAFLAATAQRPPLPTVMPAAPAHGGWAAAARSLGADRIPADFPAARLVVPTPVTYRAPDGVEVHAQLFQPPGRAAGRRAAVIFVHGGPPRQMLLGWNYSDYYSNTYALNQYLASRGFVVLSVNYRLGIGYGVEFQRPPGAGAQGAAEYQDVTAAAEYLRALPRVDPARVAIYGGSYGGYLTALALARNSDLFAAGVDMHGVHDWIAQGSAGGLSAGGLLARTHYEQPPDLERALAVAWRSSPASSMATWRSPVLLIHGDDDRNVRFAQTVDLARRLAAARVPFEELVLPDETHHLLRHANALAADSATAAFLERALGGARATRAAAR